MFAVFNSKAALHLSIALVLRLMLAFSGSPATFLWVVSEAKDMRELRLKLK